MLLKIDDHLLKALLRNTLLKALAYVAHNDPNCLFKVGVLANLSVAHFRCFILFLGHHTFFVYIQT